MKNYQNHLKFAQSCTHCGHEGQSLGIWLSLAHLHTTHSKSHTTKVSSLYMHTHINTYETIFASTRHRWGTPDHVLGRWAAAAMAVGIAQEGEPHKQYANQLYVTIESYST